MYERANGDIVFENIRLRNTNKIGVIKPDSEGCYTQVIGALGAFNSAGDFYDFDAAKRFFISNSSLMRRVSRGSLRAEWGHPKSYGMNEDQFRMRILNIDENQECGTWVEIWLSKEKLKDEQGRYVIPIMGRIRPGGPKGHLLKAKFETPGEQVCFSIRSFTEDIPSPRGYWIKRLVDIVTFDYVNEPGIWNAEKLLSPNMESFQIGTDKDKVILKASDFLNDLRYRNLGLESSYQKELIASLEEIANREAHKLQKRSFIHW